MRAGRVRVRSNGRGYFMGTFPNCSQVIPLPAEVLSVSYSLASSLRGGTLAARLEGAMIKPVKPETEAKLVEAARPPGAGPGEGGGARATAGATGEGEGFTGGHVTSFRLSSTRRGH